MTNGMSHRLPQALRLEDRGVVSLVGAGGKTSLMFRLARELFREGKRVLTTTTTRMYVPTAEQSPGYIVAPTAEEIAERAASEWGEAGHVTAGAGLLAGQGKLSGLAPEVIDRLQAWQVFDWIIVEADGAAGRPLKAPAEHEPVIPSSSGWVVGTVGLSALGNPLTDQWVFRPETVARITGLPTGAAITAEAVAAVLGHPQGILKGAPDGCRCLVFLNQADVPGGRAAGLKICSFLKRLRPHRILRAIIGRALGEPPVSAVFDLSGR